MVLRGCTFTISTRKQSRVNKCWKSPTGVKVTFVGEQEVGDYFAQVGAHRLELPVGGLPPHLNTKRCYV